LTGITRPATKPSGRPESVATTPIHRNKPAIPKVKFSWKKKARTGTEGNGQKYLSLTFD